MIEMIVVITVIGIMATFVIPSFFLRRATSPIDRFAEEFSALVQAGVIAAVDTGRAQRVMFDFKESVVKLETMQQASGDPNASTAQFVPATSLIAATEIDLPDPEEVQVKQLFVGGEELLAGAKSRTAWFFISADGRVQEVALTLVDVEAGLTVQLITNPFSGRVVLHEGARKA